MRLTNIKKILSFFCLEQRKHISKICHMFGIGFSLPILKEFLFKGNEKACEMASLIQGNENAYETGILASLVISVIIFEVVAIAILFKEEDKKND